MEGQTVIQDAFWVDNKSFPTEQSPNSIYGRVFSDYYYGDSRHIGWMDISLLKSKIKELNVSHIILRNLDTLGKIADITGQVLVCVNYTHKKNGTSPFAQKKSNLKNCEPVYATAVWGGWEFSDEDSEIPEQAIEYMKFLLVHTRVDSITCQTNKVKVTVHFASLGRIAIETKQKL